MTKLKCWKKSYSNEIATNWKKIGSYTNETLRPMVDVRLISKGQGFRIESYDLAPNRKIYERVATKNKGEKRAIQVMRKYDKC